MMRLSPIILILLVAASTVFSQELYKEIDVKDGGTIIGTVKFVGNIVSTAQFEITKDLGHCGTKKQFDRLIIGKNNGVKNAVVSIEGVSEGKPFPLQKKYAIDQRNCEYVPHVQVVPGGAQLQIVNSDNILHNVHAYAESDGQLRTVCNIAQPIKGQRTTIRQTQLAGVSTVLTTCDAGHPWMSGHVILSENPYYAVTDSEGLFTLTEIPPGSYKVRMWHEGFRITGTEVENGEVKQYHFEDSYEVAKQVSISKNTKVRVDFELVSR
jgi:hypothetical protein